MSLKFRNRHAMQKEQFQQWQVCCAYCINTEGRRFEGDISDQ